MKKFTLIICLLSLFSLQCKIFHQGQNTTAYRVYKIDSIKSYYLIYAQKDQLRYKIVSKKANVECRSIVVNRLYDFELHSMTQINGVSITPSASKYEVSGMSVDDSTTVNFEKDTQWDLYYANNIKGLCFTKK